jgi:hypothetical protein
MSHFQQHKDFYDKPIHLFDWEKKDPLAVLDQFFTDYSLSEIREMNQQADHICLSTDTYPYNDPEERDRLLAYRKSEERLVEAASILLQNSEAVSNPADSQNAQKESKAMESAPIDLQDLQDRVLDIQLKVDQLCSVVSKAWLAKVKELVL